MTAYYNEIDPAKAAWLRELIKHGLIAPGDVDERDIKDVRPNDLKGYTQCHFFAGVGIWSYALRLAGWPDSRPVWTGSCPCQPFSTAGRGKGVADERHLWPYWAWIIEQSKPDVVLGEQVSSKDGRAWFDSVLSQMEGMGYAGGALDSGSASVGAPHIRQRLHWFAAKGMGDRFGTGLERHGGHGGRGDEPGRIEAHKAGPVAETGAISGMADNPDQRRQRRRTGQKGDGEDQARFESKRLRNASRVADVHSNGCDQARQRIGTPRGRGTIGNHGISARQSSGRPTNGFWANADWLFCRDGRWRPVEPGSFPLVDGASARVVRLRGYGDGINAEQTAIFIDSVMDILLGEVIENA